MLTTVILTPGACEGRVSAAVHDTRSSRSAACAKVAFRHTETAILRVQQDIRSTLGRKKAPAGILGGAPSMYLCFEDVQIAYCISLRHNNQDLVSHKNKKVSFCEGKSPCGMQLADPGLANSQISTTLINHVIIHFQNSQECGFC